MISIQIKELKQFMNTFLTSDCFDSFLLAEAEITTYNTFSIDGHIRKEFYTKEEWEDSSAHPYPLSSWKTMRPICFDLIKGRHVPLHFKFILQLIPEATEKILQKGECSIIPEQQLSFILTVRYSENTVTLTTGTASAAFSLDKTPEQLWDKALQVFLDKKGIA